MCSANLGFSVKKNLYGNKSLHRNKKYLGFSVGCTRYVCTWYLRTTVGYVLCTTYVQPGISSYVPGMSRLPRYVYVGTYEPRTKSIVKKSTTGSLPPAMPLAITTTFSPWTHTSDDSYNYQLSLALGTSTVSYVTNTAPHN